MISVYAYKFLIIGEDLNIINNLKNWLLERFHTTDLGSVSHHLCMYVIQKRNYAKLDQKNYLKKVFILFGMDIYKPYSSPMDLGVLEL